jgi:hydroxypyruvate reductase
MTRTELARLLGAALRELDLAALVENALEAPSRAPARVIAIGKAAPAMASGAIARWGASIEHCLVVTPKETDLDAVRRAASRARIGDRLVVMHGSHPLPDASSVRAGAACLGAVAGGEPRRILVLVSGGASALVCAPSAGVTLRTKRDVTRALLHSGASVQDLNVVRKHLSRIKGGGLARAAGANAVRTLIASDVIGGARDDVGSGPSVPDTSTIADARRVLRRFAPAFADVPLARTFRPDDSSARRDRAQLVASPEVLARVVAELLRARGLVVRVLPPSQASAEELAAEYVARASRSSGGAFVRIAEPSLAVPARAGRGGRSTHVATLVGRALSPLRSAMFAAFASDGVDGTSGTGGAIVDEHFATRLETRLGATALERALARFDTGSLHRAAGTAIPAGPTGHNLADVHVLIVA